MLFGELWLDYGQSEVQKEEGTDEDQWDVKHEGYWGQWFLCCRHESRPAFQSHACEYGNQGIEYGVKIHLIEIGVPQGLATKVAGRALIVPTVEVVLVLDDQASVFIDTPPLKDSSKQLQACNRKYEEEEQEDDNGVS